MLLYLDQWVCDRFSKSIRIYIQMVKHVFNVNVYIVTYIYAFIFSKMMLMPLIAFKMKTKMRFYRCNFYILKLTVGRLKLQPFMLVYQSSCTSSGIIKQPYSHRTIPNPPFPFIWKLKTANILHSISVDK